MVVTHARVPVHRGDRPWYRAGPSLPGSGPHCHTSDRLDRISLSTSCSIRSDYDASHHRTPRDAEGTSITSRCLLCTEAERAHNRANSEYECNKRKFLSLHRTDARHRLYRLQSGRGVATSRLCRRKVTGNKTGLNFRPRRLLWLALQKGSRLLWRAMLFAELGSNTSRILTKNLYAVGMRPGSDK